MDGRTPALPQVILAIDTATGPCSVAVWKDGGVVSYVENIQPTQQSASLMVMVEEALASAGISYPALSGVACTTGPGSFTGIRVGLASASGIAFAAKIEGLGFTTMEVLAFGALRARPEANMILAVLNAGKGEFYYQAFSAKPFAALGEALVGSLEAVRAAAGEGVQCGNVPLIEGFVDAGVFFPKADALAGLAASGIKARALRPFYIRDADAKPQVRKPL